MNVFRYILADAGCGCDDPLLVVDESTADVSSIILNRDDVREFASCCWNSVDDSTGWRSGRKGADGQQDQREPHYIVLQLTFCFHFALDI